tara:strand:+ start:90 stop:623 length:534 start_codon:yes stop_codon:yes gene_type:complete
MRIFTCLFVLSCLLSSGARAQDTPVPAKIVYRDVALRLNGYGEREVMWMDVYRCALYLARRSADPAEIVRTREPKLLVIRVLTDNAPADMPARWRETLDAELTAPLFRRIKKSYRRAGTGDVLKFAYLPGKGTRFYFNDRLVLTDPGYGLMESLLDQWLGARPVSRNLKRLLAPATG